MGTAARTHTSKRAQERSGPVHKTRSYSFFFQLHQISKDVQDALTARALQTVTIILILFYFFLLLRASLSKMRRNMSTCAMRDAYRYTPKSS